MTSENRSAAELLNVKANNVPHGVLTAHPIVTNRAEGAHLWDTSGRRYLDLVGGIGLGDTACPAR